MGTEDSDAEMVLDNSPGVEMGNEEEFVVQTDAVTILGDSAGMDVGDKEVLGIHDDVIVVGGCCDCETSAEETFDVVTTLSDSLDVDVLTEVVAIPSDSAGLKTCIELVAVMVD